MDDVSAITQLVVRERQGRDRGRWDRMRDAWETEGRVRISWIDGSATEFIARSITMSEEGTRATHRLSPPVIDVAGQRAIVEVPAVIEMRITIGGADMDLASRVRLLYRVRKHSGEWLLHGMTCVYESDAVSPVSPDRLPDIPGLGLERHRPSYRWLAAVLSDGGFEIADDLPGEDRPETIRQLERAEQEWLDGHPDTVRLIGEEDS